MRANIVTQPSVYGMNIRGMGQSVDDGGTDQDYEIGGSVGTTGTIAVNPTFTVGGVTYSSTTGDVLSTNTNTTNGTTAASTNTFASALSAISSSFTNIFKAIQPIPNGCSQVNTAYGSSVQCGTGVTASSLLSSLTSGSSSTLLLLGGAAIILMMMMNKK